MSARHAGRVAVVTGGSSGIGQAIVCRLAREGARVAIADIVDADETLELVRRDGGNAFGARCDIGDGSQVVDFIREVGQRYASPQVLVHSAAVRFNRPFAEVTFEEWRRTQAVNQDSMFHLLQATLPAMKAAGWGRIGGPDSLRHQQGGADRAGPWACG
jgi:3-oxoacyl-[acyl-carrier protein] reductase